MREQICLRAPAKINWNLEVTGLREDGYHELRSIMQNISLYDTIWLSLADSDDCICEPACDCSIADNLAMRAWLLLKKQYKLNYHIHIIIKKEIPFGRGLAGGSADAAAVLLGANALLELGLSLEELSELGFSLGSDIPFCLYGGLAVVKGAGENVKPLSSLLKYRLILIDPEIFLSTPQVFAQFDQLPIENRSDTKKLLAAVLCGDFEQIAAQHGNMLEASARAICSQIGQIRSRLEELGGVVFFSGSGSCFFVLNDGDIQEAQYMDMLEQQGMKAIIIETLNSGIEIIA